MSIIGSNILAGASGQGGEYTIEESLRFNASQSSYLSWTPASAGNRKTWTWSGWVKRGQLGTTQQLFYAKDGSNYVQIGFTTANQLQIQLGTPRRRTVRVFRDPSAWYHIVGICDTTDATGDDRLQLWVNGVRETSFDEDTDPTLNANYTVNNTVQHNIGRGDATHYADGYLTEVNFIDGQALDPSSFGEFDSVTGVWKPVGYTGTYGTNGFYLPMQLDNTVEGFNTVTYLGTGSTQRITGVGFQPDLVWIKNRNIAGQWHVLHDSVRGAGKRISSNDTYQEVTENALASFDTDGFTVTTGDNGYNGSSGSYVAWCWDAGSSTVSNTDGSITSSVRANPTYGFSVVTYTGTGSNATVGHGLGVAPSMVIIKQRNGTGFWVVGTSSLSFTSDNYLRLNDTSAVEAGGGVAWNNTAPTSTTVSIGNSTVLNASGNDYVMYCFSEVAGYSKFGSYTGTGASGNTVTTGFKPAFVMVKRTDVANDWYMFDNTRDVDPSINAWLIADGANAEASNTFATFTNSGFTITGTSGGWNASGGTYIYMAFKDTREYAYWLDGSGNNNDWQPNGGITTNSTVTDTPTPYADGGNYAVLNPVSGSVGSAIISNANLYSSVPATGAYGGGKSTIGISNASGKWYFEVSATSFVNSGSVWMVLGLTKDANLLTSFQGQTAGSLAYAMKYNTTGAQICNETTAIRTDSGIQFAQGDVLQCAFDADTGKLWFGKNNSWFDSGSGTTGNPSAGTSQTMTTTITDSLFPFVQGYSTSGATAPSVNFGQRPFAYTPPTGFLPLHTGNLPDSAIVDGSEYFNTVLYTGDGGTQSITGVGFQPDFGWFKTRNSATHHALVDAVRGVDKYIYSSLTVGEETATNALSSFDADGFSFAGSFGNVNRSGDTYVAWNWKANGAGVSNTDGSITSTVSANPTSGFSIVTYTGTGTGTPTIGHGLGVAPDMIIAKTRSTANGWLVYHSALGATKSIILNGTNAASTQTDWGNTTPTSTVFYVNGGNNNISAATYVAYCFADVEGYSKFGSYTGNGSTDGPFIFCGFRPRWVMIKRANAAEHWVIRDTARDPHNESFRSLYANLSNADDPVYAIDILSNGFKLRGSGPQFNASGSTYIYMAFAENPFKNSLAR